jgi:hypothetical protein
MILCPLGSGERARPYRHIWLPYLKRAAARLGNTLETCLAEVTRGECTVLLVLTDEGEPVAAGGIRIFDKAAGRALEVNWAAGNGAALLAVTPQLEDYARSLGCNRIFIPGRKGWSRVFPREYRVERITIGRAL